MHLLVKSVIKHFQEVHHLCFRCCCVGSCQCVAHRISLVDHFKREVKEGKQREQKVLVFNNSGSYRQKDSPQKGRLLKQLCLHLCHHLPKFKKLAHKLVAQGTAAGLRHASLQAIAPVDDQMILGGKVCFFKQHFGVGLDQL